MQAAADANLWLRRLGHFKRKSLDLLKKHDHNAVRFNRAVPVFDVCAIEKSHQLTHPKIADHKAPLVGDLIGATTPEALGGYKHVRKISDQDTM